MEPQADGIRSACTPLHEHSLFILDDDRNPVPCPSMETWAIWMGNESNRRVGVTHIGAITISTQFMGVRIDAPPESGLDNLFFETQISRGFLGGDSIRTQTYKGAMHAHGFACGVVTRFRFIPAFIQEALRLIHWATTYFRFCVTRVLRAFFSAQ